MDDEQIILDVTLEVLRFLGYEHLSGWDVDQAMERGGGLALEAARRG